MDSGFCLRRGRGRASVGNPFRCPMKGLPVIRIADDPLGILVSPFLDNVSGVEHACACCALPYSVSDFITPELAVQFLRFGSSLRVIRSH